VRAFLACAAPLLLTALVCTACGGGVARSYVLGRCAGGATHPLKRDFVLRELRRSGFRATASTRAEQCRQSDPSMAYAISNAVEDIDAYNRTEDEYGIVYCSLYTHAVFDLASDTDLHERANSPIFHGRKAHFWVANLECLLYAGDERQDQQVQALFSAMKRIANRAV
jgi:hypothetical protein